MRYTLGSAARFRRWWGAVPTWRHRERVRFGAREERPRVVVWKPLDLTPYRGGGAP